VLLIRHSRTSKVASLRRTSILVPAQFVIIVAGKAFRNRSAPRFETPEPVRINFFKWYGISAKSKHLG